MIINISKKSTKQIMNILHNNKRQLSSQFTAYTSLLNSNIYYEFCLKNNEGSHQTDKEEMYKQRLQEVKIIDKDIQKKILEFENTVQASQFDERKFFQSFQSLINNYSLNKEGQVTKLIDQLKIGLPKVQRIQTIINVLDKSARYNIYLGQQFEIQLLEHGLKLINNKNYYDLNSDQGDLVKGFTLVAGLKKIRYYPFYESILDMISKQGNKFSIKNILTIIETICYNKLAQNLKNSGETIPQSLQHLKNVTIADLEIFSAISNLICYFLKYKSSIFYGNEKYQFQNITEEIFKSVHNSLLGILSSNSQSIESIDVFTICEIQNHLEIYSKLSQKEEILFIQRKFNNNFQQFINRNYGQKTYYDYEKVLRYVKKYLTSPPIILNPQIIRLISQTYNSVKPQSLSEVVPFLYFLSKTVQGFKIPYESIKTIEDNLKNEKNILILSKLMEIYSTTQHSNDIAISDLENRIIQLSSYSANPTSPLLIFFQSLTNMQKGQQNTIKYIVDYFKYPGVLDKIEFFDLIVKFIPSLAIKTKELFKFTTNMSFQSSTNYIEESSKIDPELQKSNFLTKIKLIPFQQNQLSLVEFVYN